MVCGTYWTCEAVNAHSCVFPAEGGDVPEEEQKEVGSSGLRKSLGPAQSCGGGCELDTDGRQRHVTHFG